MTDARHLCRCDRPIHDGAHLCPSCIGAMRRDLRALADRWEDLEAALTSPGAAPIHLTPPETPIGDNRGNIVGISINDAVSKARSLTSELAWFAIQVIRDDYDDIRTAAVETFDQSAKELAHRELWEDGVPETLGRMSAAVERATFTPPTDQSVPNLLQWVERWHLTHLVMHGAEETANELADQIHQAEQATFNALNPSRTVHVGIPCTDHGTTDLGERVPCAGHMTARSLPGVMPDLVCSEDSGHRIGADRWQRDGWRGRFAKPLDHAGMARLAGRLGLRGT